MHYGHVSCDRHHHPSPKPFSHCKTETLSPLNTTSPPPPQPLAAATPLSVCQCVNSRELLKVELYRVSFWPISLSLMSSRPVRVVASVSFLPLRAE